MHVCKKYPQALGGDAVVVASLQQQQETTGHTVAIVTSNCDQINNGPRIYKFGLKDTPARLDVITPKRLVSLLCLTAQIFGFIRKERPDVIHTHSIDLAFAISFAARLHRVPVIHTFHIVTFCDINQSATRRVSELLLAKSSGISRITAPNVHDVRQLHAAGLEQAALLPNGVDTTFWASKESGNKSRDFTFVTVGRLEPQKGYDYLIRATALLAAKWMSRTFRVVIIGEGSQESALRELAVELEVGDVITFAGRRGPGDVRACLSTADAAVFPSLYETTPLAVLEAWAASLPVIVTPVGILQGATESFRAALVVPPRNEGALMRAMERLIVDEPLRGRIAGHGYREAKKYAWPPIAQMAEAIYRKAM